MSDVYTYTLLRLALDLDTHTYIYFRRYLETFINKREISKNLREFVGDPSLRTYLAEIHPNSPGYGKFNELRLGLPHRVFEQFFVYTFDHLSTPKLIEDIHPPVVNGVVQRSSKDGNPYCFRCGDCGHASRQCPYPEDYFLPDDY